MAAWRHSSAGSQRASVGAAGAFPLSNSNARRALPGRVREARSKPSARDGLSLCVRRPVVRRASAQLLWQLLRR